MRWPLPGVKPEVLLPPHPGSFSVERKFDVHTGIDLYCDEGQEVVAIEPGKIVAIEAFTGNRAESPWWNETFAIMVEGDSGVVLYGEIIPRSYMNVGDNVLEGELLGHVKTVLKKDKGFPMTMLHFELYSHGVYNSVWWKLNEKKPDSLLNPTELLENCRKNIDG